MMCEPPEYANIQTHFIRVSHNREHMRRSTPFISEQRIEEGAASATFMKMLLLRQLCLCGHVGIGIFCGWLQTTRRVLQTLLLVCAFCIKNSRPARVELSEDVAMLSLTGNVCNGPFLSSNCVCYALVRTRAHRMAYYRFWATEWKCMAMTMPTE